MKEEAIIFDTNFIIEHKNKLEEIIKNLSEKYDICIPELVINEIQGQQRRKISKEYERVKAIIEENKYIMTCMITSDCNKTIRNKEKQIDKFFKDLIPNVIGINKENRIDILLERAKEKRAPFNKADNSSDKGFKDTLIFLDLIDYMKENKYKKAYLITLDSEFKKNKEELQEEYKRNAKNELEILNFNDIKSLYKHFNIKAQTEEDEDKNENQDEIFTGEKPKEQKINIEEMKAKLQKIMNDIIYTDIGDVFITNYTENFNIHELINDEQTEEIVVNIENILKKLMFFNTISVRDFLYNIDITLKYEISVNDLKQLLELYNQIKDNEEIKKAFILYVKKCINKTYKYKPEIKDDELPF